MLDRLATVMERETAGVVSDQDKVVEAPLGHDLSALEKTLGSLVPHGMPEDIISRLDGAMARWHEKVPLEEKVVPLSPAKAAPSSFPRPGWRMVAAVALAGVVAAVLTTENSGDAGAIAEKIPVRSDGNAARVVFKPAPEDTRSEVLSANDHGVFWTKDGIAFRFVEVESQAEVHFRNEMGQKIVIARPKKEIQILPVKFD